MSEQERERERGREGGRERGREGGRERVCVCAFARARKHARANTHVPMDADTIKVHSLTKPAHKQRHAECIDLEITNGGCAVWIPLLA